MFDFLAGECPYITLRQSFVVEYYIGYCAVFGRAEHQGALVRLRKLFVDGERAFFVADIKTAVTALCRSSVSEFIPSMMMSFPSASLEEIHSIFADVVFRTEPHDGTLVVNRLAYAQTYNQSLVAALS